MKILLFILAVGLALPVLAAEDTLINLPPSRPTFVPGTIFHLPDGRRGSIVEILPDGRLNTDIGIILSPEGVILDGAEPGTAVQVVPPVAEVRPESENAEIPKSPAILLPSTPVPEDATAPAPAPEATPAQPPVPAQPAVIPGANPDHRYTIAELLPKTEVPDKSVPEKVLPKKEEKAPPSVKKAEEKKVEPPKKSEKKSPEPKKPEKKQEVRPEKPKAGQPLRIPDEAVKTGNLSFLEGCWQGTRPEYYSKRTIKECFCFGAGGKTGKRRVIDPIGRRRCIGATKATLSGNGVLSVTSSGAACDDGERWGQAEMVCRNTGPKTPCSWVFRDANNGHQSCQIPFVRVESCGR